MKIAITKNSKEIDKSNGDLAGLYHTNVGDSQSLFGSVCMQECKFCINESLKNNKLRTALYSPKGAGHSTKRIIKEY